MNYAATIGFFDGVHVGHQKVIERLKTVAAERGMPTMVITFANHPMEVVQPGYEPDMLLPLHEKVERLRQTGVDRVEVLEFTRQMMATPARDFMADTLRDVLGVRLLLLGYDNRFGKRDDTETFESYCGYGHDLGIEVIEGPRPEECGLFEGHPVSSSLIRSLIRDGRIAEAEKLF